MRRLHAACRACSQICQEPGGDISGFRGSSGINIDAMRSLVENPQRALKLGCGYRQVERTLDGRKAIFLET
jgi:hypothetical protein